jgi:hypothetical protein
MRGTLVRDTTIQSANNERLVYLYVANNTWSRTRKLRITFEIFSRRIEYDKLHDEATIGISMQSRRNTRNFRGCIRGRIDHVDINEQIYIRDISNPQFDCIKCIFGVFVGCIHAHCSVLTHFTRRFPVMTSSNYRVSCNVNRGKHFYQTSQDKTNSVLR